jgi:dethiobiotin synthetase
MKRAYFVTGTDTDAGKTLVSSALLLRARQQGWQTAAVKPVATGGLPHQGVLKNDDALQLQRQSTLLLDYALVNPVCLHDPIAPHIAAQEAGIALHAALLATACRRVLALGADFTLIEGAGGWRVPLNDRETLADLARLLGLPVILVVNMKLGCINHALLSCEAIAADGLPLAGWVANRAAPQMSRFEQNLASLDRLLPAPRLGMVPHLTPVSAEQAAPWLRLPD